MVFGTFCLLWAPPNRQKFLQFWQIFEFQVASEKPVCVKKSSLTLHWMRSGLTFERTSNCQRMTHRSKHVPFYAYPLRLQLCFGSRCFICSYLHVKKLLAGNGRLHACRFANLCSNNAYNPSFESLGSRISNALRIISLRCILFPRKKFFGKSRPP